jgi:hypothetical protein
MYDLDPGTRLQTINASSAYRILAEIKTYLVMLKSEGSYLLNEIRDFTRSFGGVFTNFDIDPYISRINQAAAKGLTRGQILGDELYSIALPPKAVADYFKRMWGRRTNVSEFVHGTGSGDGVIGVSSSEYDGTTGMKKPYYGLEHYMYRSRGRIYSWGKSFPSVQDASFYGAGGVVWRVCYVIH